MGRESERYDILYTDGLEVIRITALDPIASTYMPGRQDFQAPARDSESSPLLYADGGYIVMAEKMYRIADDDVYRMLWSMLPGGREDEYEATSGIELKPNIKEVHTMHCKPIRLLLFALWLVAAGPRPMPSS